TGGGTASPSASAGPPGECTLGTLQPADGLEGQRLAPDTFVEGVQLAGKGFGHAQGNAPTGSPATPGRTPRWPHLRPGRCGEPAWAVRLTRRQAGTSPGGGCRGLGGGGSAQRPRRRGR